MYNIAMRYRKQNSDAIGILMLLLIFPLIVYWKKILIICVIFIIAKIIYKIVKIIGNDDTQIPYVDDVVKTNEGYNPYAYDVYNEDIYVAKGVEGERKIIKILERIFSKENVIHDSYFRDDELVTTQVDIVAIDTSGIYVIESKNYSSIIKGSSKDKKWVQLFAGKKYKRFNNPIFQNKRHVDAIKKNLVNFGVPEQAFKSYIVFGDNCKLCVEIDEKCNTEIIQQKELFYKILEDRSTTLNIITEKQVSEISRRINAHANVDEITKRSHITRRQNNVKYVVKGR